MNLAKHTNRCLALTSTIMVVSLNPTWGSEPRLEEIVVTAERRAESLQEVPAAVTVLNRVLVEHNDIHDLTDIATRIPGLTFSPFSPGQNIVALRGASSNDDGAGTDNSVAAFVDDVYLGRVSNINPELFDIERIEVLRGPQGTLYGKNTIGGAINVISTRPNLDNYEGKVRLSLGNFDRFDIAGLLSGPIAARWAGKLSVSGRSRDGWVENRALDKALKDDKVLALRGQLLHSRADFEALLSADLNDLAIEDMARIPVRTGHPQDPSIWTGGSYAELCGGQDPDCSANPVDGYAKRTAWGLSAKLIWDLDIGELTSITAWRENEADWQMDSTGTSLLPLIDDIFDQTEQFTQEIRWVSNIGQDIDYVAGLWYLSEETDRTECFDLSLDSDCTTAADGGLTDWYRQVNATESYAAFAQIDWLLSENWTLALGGRYTYERKEIDNQAVAGQFVIINQTFSSSESENWEAFTPRASLTYKASDTASAYATIATGFKSGGFPAAPQGIEFTLPLEQEEAINYEVGFKSDLGGVIRINAAAFYTDYQDLQMQTFGPLTPAAAFGTFQTFNAGDAEIMGLEVEATWLVSANLVLSGFYGWQSSEFGDTDIPGTAFPDQSGQDLIRAPENKFNLNADYNLPLAGGSELTMTASWRYTDDQRGELEPWAIQPEFDVLDLRIGWTSANQALEVALWVRNLSEEYYISHLYTIASSVVAVYGDPRMYGLSLTYRFGAQ